MQYGRFRSYFAGTASLLGASVMSQAVVFAGALAIARLYGPADVGLFALFVAVWGVAIVTATWRYELAIVTVDEDGQAGDIALLVVCAAVFSGAVAIVLLLAIEALPDAAGISSAFRQELMVGVPTLVLAGPNLAGTNLCLRQRRFRRIGLQQVVNAAVTVGVQVALLGTAVPGGGLVIGFLVGQAASAAVFAPPLIPLIVSRLRIPGVVDRLWRAAREHSSYFLYTVPYTLINQLYYQTPVVIIGTYLGAKEVGFFNLAFRTTTTPFGLIPVALSQVLFPDMARDRRNMADWEGRVRAILMSLGILYAPVAAAIVAFGPDIYGLLLGGRWRETGGFAALLIVPNIMTMLCSGYDRLYFMLDRQRLAFVLMAIAFALGLAAMIATTRYSATWLIGSWGLAHLINVFVWMAAVWHISGFSLRQLVVAWAVIIGLVMALATALQFEEPMLSGHIGAVVVAVLVVAGYGYLVWRTLAPLKALVLAKLRRETPGAASLD